MYSSAQSYKSNVVCVFRMVKYHRLHTLQNRVEIITVPNKDDDNVIKILPCPYSALSSSNRINFNRN